MATITIISNDRLSRCYNHTDLSMREQARNLRDDYPIETLRTSTAIIMRSADGMRCIVQESRRG